MGDDDAVVGGKAVSIALYYLFLFSRRIRSMRSEKPPLSRKLFALLAIRRLRKYTAVSIISKFAFATNTDLYGGGCFRPTDERAKTRFIRNPAGDEFGIQGRVLAPSRFLVLPQIILLVCCRRGAA